MTETSSGFSQGNAMSYKDIDVEHILEESLETALMAQDPISIEPGKYEVILSSYAVEEFLSSMRYLSLTEKSIEEGTSFMKGHFGEKMFPHMITFYDDGNAPNTINMPFDFEGVPKKKVTIIENGVAKAVVYDSYYANKFGKENTGHALPQPNPVGPFPFNIFMKEGESSINDMIKNVKRGVFITRFHYTNPLDYKRVIITGMTRDGTFLIEDGK